LRIEWQFGQQTKRPRDRNHRKTPGVSPFESPWHLKERAFQVFRIPKNNHFGQFVNPKFFGSNGMLSPMAVEIQSKIATNKLTNEKEKMAEFALDGRCKVLVRRWIAVWFGIRQIDFHDSLVVITGYRELFVLPRHTLNCTITLNCTDDEAYAVPFVMADSFSRTIPVNQHVFWSYLLKI